MGLKKYRHIFLVFLIAIVSCDYQRSINDSMSAFSDSSSGSFDSSCEREPESSSFVDESTSNVPDSNNESHGSTSDDYTGKSDGFVVSDFDDDEYLTIMTYNVGCWFDGRTDIIPDELSDFYFELQNDSINAYSPDLCFFQEYTPMIGNYSVEETVLKNRYNCYFEENNTYSGKCISSKKNLWSPRISYFQETDDLQRNYEKAYVYLGSTRICLLSVHLAVDPIKQEKEIEEILHEIRYEKYFIIGGDFNSSCKRRDDFSYLHTYKPFVDIGCNIANCSSFGFLTTFMDEFGDQVLDNIITSKNISVLSANTCTLKQTRNVPIRDIDHLPLIAHIKVDTSFPIF